MVEDFANVDAYVDASDRWPNEIAAIRPVLLGCGLAYVREAIAHEDAGTALPPRPDDELTERLAADDRLAEAFANLTPSRRREYNLHVSGAKQSSTRARRVEQIVPSVLNGKGLRDR